VDPNDATSYSEAIWSAIQSGVAGEIAAYVAPPEPVPAVITRRQMLLQLVIQGIITGDEGVAAATTGAVPASVEAVFAAMPSDAQVAARITWASMSVAERDNPLVATLATANSMSDEDIDDFFRAAALL
jgi:hypothetical protein